MPYVFKYVFKFCNIFLPARSNSLYLIDFFNSRKVFPWKNSQSCLEEITLEFEWVKSFYVFLLSTFGLITFSIGKKGKINCYLNYRFCIFKNCLLDYNPLKSNHELTFNLQTFQSSCDKTSSCRINFMKQMISNVHKKTYWYTLQ